MKIINKYYAEISSVLVLIAYFFTMAPGVVQIDSGELATVQIKAGIAHPTGYPLYTMIGYLFSLIPLPVSKIFQMNLLAVLYTTVGTYFTIKTIAIILTKVQEIAITSNSKSKSKSAGLLLPEYVIPATSVLCGMILAFSTTYWMQSTSVEVYSLHIIFMSLLMYHLIRVLIYPTGENFKAWYIIVILLGLSFSNHMTTLMLLPAVVIIFFYDGKFRRKYFIEIIKLSGVFLFIIFAAYSYLYIRAGFNPALNWGDPDSFEKLFRHVSGKQYQVWLFSSFAAAKKQMLSFFVSLPNEFNFIVLILAVLGSISVYRISKRVFFVLASSFLFTVIYASNYDIHDIDTYYLLAFYSITLFAAIGVYAIIAGLLKKSVTPVYSIIVLALIGSYQFYSNFDKTDQSDVYIFENYTKALINSTSENAVIFSYQWDYFISPSYYFQKIEYFRNDVTVIDKELLRRSWYYDQLQNQKKDIFNGLETDVNQFLEHLKPFETGTNFNSEKLEYYYRQIMTNLILFNSEKGNYYIAPELVENEMRNNQFSLPDGFSIVPDLFLFKVVKGSSYFEAPLPDFILRIPEKRNSYHDFIVSIVIKSLTYRILYEMNFNKIERARIYADKISEISPGYVFPENIKKFLTL